MRLRNTIALAVILAVLTLGLAATPADAQGKSDLTIALGGVPTEVLDPTVNGHFVKYFLSLMFDYLIGVTPDGKLSAEGGLATKWEPSADHKRWTFTLRRGVKFQNGDEITSADVKFSVMRAMSNRSATGYAGALRTLVQDIETPTPDRVVIVTKEPTLIIPNYLSRVLSTEGMVLPKKYIESVGDDGFTRRPIGSGPYRLAEQVSGSHIKLEAMPTHFRTGAPRYKTITFRIVPEETTRIALLRRGEVDIADISRERAKELEREGYPIHLRREEALFNMWTILGADGWPEPMKDKRVREAMAIALDRNEIAQSIFGRLAEPAAIPMGLSWSFRDIGLKVGPELAYPYDPTRAKKLLAEAGHPNGFPLDLYAFQLPGFPEGKAAAEAVGGYWQKIGVKVKLIPVDYAAFRKNWIDRKTPGAMGYFNIANRDWIGTFALLEKQANSKSKLTDQVADPEIDAMVAQVLKQTDREKINALMRNIFLRMRGEHYTIPVVYLHAPYVSSKALAKWNPGTVMYDFFIDELASTK
jgi:peptide/nickel transport system substrate-binding protein